LKFKLNSNLKDTNVQYAANYQINNVQWNNCKAITARGRIENNTLLVKEGTFLYKNIPFNFRGTLEDFAAPRINTTIENGIFSLIAKTRYKEGVLVLERAHLKGKGTSLTATGRLHAHQNPFTKLEGSGKVSLNDVKEAMKTFHKSSSFIEKTALEGIINTKFSLSDKAGDHNWQLKLTGVSERITIYNLTLEAVTIDLLKEGKLLTVSPVLATLAQGKVDVRTKVDFENKKVTLNCIANDIDLHSLKEQLKLKSKNLSGKLSLEARLENNSLSDVTNPTGQGKIVVKEGNIWEINFLKGLGEFLFIPDFEDIQVKEGYSDFALKNDTVIFENLELNAPQMDLKGGGKISHGGTIHFMLFPQFNPDLIAASEGLKKITTSVLGKSGLLIEIEGSLKEPTYTVKPLFLSPMEKIKNFFRELQS
jgi:hypothetical protein